VRPLPQVLPHGTARPADGQWARVRTAAERRSSSALGTAAVSRPASAAWPLQVADDPPNHALDLLVFGRWRRPEWLDLAFMGGVWADILRLAMARSFVLGHPGATFPAVPLGKPAARIPAAPRDAELGVGDPEKGTL